MNKFMNTIAGLALFLVVVLVRGFVLTYLWLWFMVPLGPSKLKIPHAIGIAMLVSYLTKYSVQTGPGNPTKEAAIEAIMTAILAALMTLLFGYIVHSFM